ncbi:hypothetical protein J2S28_005734 [Rhizobium sp. SLBN-94]|nr:hypothetical protein [Rhizobium sp. SLBN-94]
MLCPGKSEVGQALRRARGPVRDYLKAGLRQAICRKSPGAVQDCRLCLIENRLRLDRPPATAFQNSLPLSAVRPFLADQQSFTWPPSISFRPYGCGPIVPDGSDVWAGRTGNLGRCAGGMEGTTSFA